MIQDKWQALEDLLAGWKHYVLDGYQKGYENAYPLGYVTATERLYQKAVDVRLAGGDPSEFAREHLLPLLGIEPPPRVVYGWTEGDVLGRWDELRSWGEVEDQDMPMEDALKLLEEALARDVTYTRGDELLEEAVTGYAAKNGLAIQHDG